ncbi:MAG: transglutaminaseTgpA domain-containing protein, partial [Candidatus Korobacteraceae bacterium]
TNRRSYLLMADQNSNTAASQGIFQRIDQLCQISLVLLLGTGLFTLVGTGKLDGFSIVVATAALAVRGAMLLRGNNWTVPARWTSLLGLLYVLLFLVDCFFISRSFVNASIHLVLFGIVVKLFSVERDRDLLYLAVLAFLEVLAAAILTVETGFLTAFALFVVVSIGTFIALEIRRSVVFSHRAELLQTQLPSQPTANRRLFETQAPPPQQTQSQRVLETPSADPHWRQLYRALAAITIAQALGIVLCASLIFFALPRLAGGYLGDLAQQTDLMSGFGERVRLGQIGRIQQSSQVVMHVRFDGTAPPEIRLRGASLANFDGQNWSSSPHGVAPVVTISQAFFRPAEPGGLRSFASGHTARLVQYRVILEPIGTNVVFVVPTPRALFGNTRQVLESFDESIETLDPDRFLSSYSGVSDIAQPSRADLMEASGAAPRGMPARYATAPAAARSHRQLSFRAQARTLRVLCLGHGGDVARARRCQPGSHRLPRRRVQRVDGKLHHPRPRRARLGGSLHSRQRLGHLRPHSGKRGNPGPLEQAAALPRRRQRILAGLGGQLRLCPSAHPDGFHHYPQPPGQRESLGDVYRRLPAPDRMGARPEPQRFPAPAALPSYGNGRHRSCPMHPAEHADGALDAAKRPAGAARPRPETRRHPALRADDARHREPWLAAQAQPNPLGVRLCHFAYGVARRRGPLYPALRARPLRRLGRRCRPAARIAAAG